MTLLRVLAATCVVVLVLTTSGDARQAQDRLDYQTFARLSPDERFAYWNRTTPEVRSELAQAHANAWLTANQQRLTSAQVANLKAVIALLTPDFYGDPTSRESLARSAEMERTLLCTLWKSDVVQAFMPTGKAISVTWMDDVSSWLRKCYLS
jgi:hypothetical protein